jgi:hypothetical protein
MEDRKFELMKMFSQKIIGVILIFLASISFYSCQKETDDLEVYDYLDYYESEVVFTDHFYSIINDNTAELYTTITVPSDLKINDYGHCWITINGTPTISDTKTSFGPTNLKTLIITSTINNYSSWKTYYGRAYIRTEYGIVYDLTYYF